MEASVLDRATSCEDAIAAVIEQLVSDIAASEEFLEEDAADDEAEPGFNVDGRALELAHYLVPGLVYGDFSVDPEDPHSNPVHKRVHDILVEQGYIELELA